MSDADNQSNLQTDQDQAQNPLDSPVGPYTLKRLHPSADMASVRAFFTQLDGIKEEGVISANFTSLFQNTPAFNLRYTRQSYFDGEHPAEMYLFKSDLALIIYD